MHLASAAVVAASVAAFVALLGLGVSTSAPANDGPEESDESPLVATGEITFQRYCAACHGIGGTGDGPAAKAMLVPPTDLTLLAARRGGELETAAVVGFIDGRVPVGAHGSRDMPIWGKRFSQPVDPALTGDEVARGQLDALVEYLVSIQRPAEQ